MGLSQAQGLKPFATDEGTVHLSSEARAQLSFSSSLLCCPLLLV